MENTKDNILKRRSKLSPAQRELLEKRLRGEVGSHSGLEVIPKHSQTSPAPLSFAQQRLWFLHQLDPDNPYYSEVASVKLLGTLYVNVLEKSLNEIVRRHEALRTSFEIAEEQAVQVIHPVVNIELSVVNLQFIPEVERQAQIERLTTEIAQKPFDLTVAPLLRAMLLQTDEEEYIMVFAIHHIVVDGWSFGVLIRELVSLYEAFSLGKKSPLPELPIQYVDFTVWQRQHLQRKLLPTQLDYWKKQLAGADTLNLPTDHARPPVQSFRGAVSSFELPANLTSMLRDLSDRSGATLFMTLLSAFQVLLYRYTGQEDICVGSPIANRNQSEIQGLIGFFANTLVLRTYLSGNPSFLELLNRVREACVDAYAHADIPFEKLVEELQLERNLSHMPLFQVMFALQEDTQKELSLPDLTLNWLPSHTQTSRLDLTLHIIDAEPELRGLLEYNTDLFDAETITRIVEHFCTLLEGIVANPEQSVSELPLLTTPERYQLLEEWNNTKVEYPQDKCIHQLFEAQVEKIPNAVAVVFEDQQLTYRELNKRANQLAHHLRSLGVKPEVLVGICVERSLEIVIGLLAILKAGGAYVPLDPNYPQERLAYMLEDSQPSVLLTQQCLLESLPSHQAQVICINSNWEQIADKSTENPAFNTTIDNLAYVIYTSGSTGKPKGAMNSHSGICNRLLWMQDTYQLISADAVLQKTPFSFDVSVWEFFWTLITGARLVVAQPEGHRDPNYLVNLIRKQRITTLHFVPSMLQVFLEAGGLEECQSLVRVIASGEALPVQLQERFFNRLNAQLHNLYGPTEAAVDVTYWECKKDNFNDQSIVPIGQPIANIQIYILDKYLKPVPMGVAGELYIGGVGVARGYLNRPDLSAEKFIPNPFSAEATRLYKTGDLARYLPSGDIEYIGRIDNQVKVRGFRIELGEIESVISQYPAVRETVVVVREDEVDSQRIIAYVVAQTEQTFTINELRSFLESKLSSYMVPATFVTLEALPLTPNGKVDRKALPAPELTQILSSDIVPASTPIENLLAGIWAEVLGIEKVGIYNNFFELGGHSLVATRVISQIRQVFQLELSLRSLFEKPTIAGLAKEIEKAIKLDSTVEATSIERIPRSQQLPLSFAQQRLWFLAQLEPESSFYNIRGAVRLEGKLNVEALQESFNEIVRRHEALRTNFLSIEGQAVAVISEEKPLRLSILDISDLPKNQREVEVKQQATQEAQQPFDISSEYLLRVKVLRLGEQEHIVLLTMHHMVSDGWSIGVLIQELATFYSNFCNREPISYGELPIQYVDFAAWQRQWLQGETLETQISYWLKQLEGAPKVLELPTDHPRPAIQTFRGATYSFKLSKELSTALNKLSQQQGSTLFMTLLAGFQTLLWRYTAIEDIVVGSPIANRNRAEIEGLIGFFVNTLVLRTNLAGNPSFEELLKRVRELALGAYAHQDLPFELLVERLKVERDLSHAPLFQVMFVLQNAPVSALDLPGLTLTPVEGDSDTSKFDLSLYMTETESGLVGNLEYNTDLFEEISIQRMAAHLQTLLLGIVANPQQRLSELPLLKESEQHQLLRKWNDTQVDYPLLCIHKLFEAQVEKTPDVIAVVFEDQELTYRELNQWANQLAHYLKSLEVGSGVLVGICFEPSLEQVVSLLAVLKANGVYVPLDPNYPQERLSFMLENSNVRTLLTKEYLTEKISSQNAHIVCLDRDGDAIARESVENLNLQTTPDDLAYAIYTSGSTGKPKAVLGKIRGIINRLHWMWETLPFGASEVCIQKTSINFVDHIAEIFSPLLKGIPLVVVPDNIRSDVLRLMSLLSDRKITRIVVVPSLLKAMLDTTSEELTKLQYLKYVFCSGEALPLKLAESFHQKLSSARLFNLYGSSEVAADVTCYEVNFWETRQRILQYFKPQVVREQTENQELGVDQKLFTKPGVSAEMLATQFQRSELPSYPLTVDDYNDKLSKEVLPYTIDTGSPTYIGHMTSALPDFMHDMSKMISQLNQNLVKIETSKSLIFLEREAIAMLHRLVYGFRGEFYQENIQQKNRNLGIITTGGTTANISALLCARNSGLLSEENSWELSKESLYKVLSKKGYDDIVIIGSRLMHYSLNKASSILGLGTDNIIFIDSNDNGKLDINLLKEKIVECRRNKLYILALVGIAGTTETGEIDPLMEMGDIAQEFGIHFHVDGAWGGATMFSDKHKGKLKGINKADSITICGHKQLYLPQGISVCLFKDPQMLNLTATTARYQAQRDTFDVGRFTIEGSRSAISLCLHGALHIIGKKGYEILINNSIEKAQYFSRIIDQLEPFELIIEPSLNIVNYRYIPEDLRAKAAQKSLSDYDIQRINQLNTQIQFEQFEQGITFVSKTTLLDSSYDQDKQIVVFRTVLSNPNTTARDLRTVLEDQLRIANQIEARSKEKGNNYAAVESKKVIPLQLTDNLKTDNGEALEEYLKKNTIPIGKPISNTQIYILDKHGSLLPPGITGELYVGGDGLAQGYLNMPELTEEKFIPNPFIKDNDKTKTAAEARLYRTGDLARWLPDGNIEFVGRIDHQVKIRGFRVELGEIEAVINQYPAVREVVVLVREDSLDFQRIVAYVVAQKEQTLTITELREFLESKLPNYMVPAAFITLEALPLTPNGKLNRKALPVPDTVRPELEETYVAPQTNIEKQLANIWAELLVLEKIGINDNFFELGGHSLLATQVISRINKTFDIELPLRRLFEFPTLAKLAKSIENEKVGSNPDRAIQRVSRNIELPLSFGQQRLWFIDKLDPNSFAYNFTNALVMKGMLQVQALEDSVNEIVRRHEVLRTYFEASEEQTIQKILPVLKISLAIVDLQNLPEIERKVELQRLEGADAQQPFNLTQAPLLRLTLVRLETTEHILLTTMHHIIFDAWSVGIFIQELSSLYKAFSKGQPTPLGELPIQYADYAMWQQESLKQEKFHTQIAYWKQQLEGAKTVLELPTDKPRSQLQTSIGTKHHLTLSKELSHSLKILSKQQGVTLFMTLLTGFNTLLYHYTKQEDILVGSPIANRNRSEIEGLIGFFVNTLVLRTNLSKNPSFKELLQQVNEVALGAYTHQDLPFEKLITELQVERTNNRSPLFQVWFVLQNAPASNLELEELNVNVRGIESGMVRHDLNLNLSETSEDIKGFFEYKTDLFKANTIAQMAKLFETLLEIVVKQPDIYLKELVEMLSESQKEQQILENQEFKKARLQRLGKISRKTSTDIS